MTDTETNQAANLGTMGTDWETGEIFRPWFRTHYNYDMNSASLQSGLHCTDATRTQQQFAEEVDINTIVRRFGLTGQLPNNLRVPMVGDFSEVGDYQSCLNLLLEADDAFMQLPADVREQFGNDAGRFVDYASDPQNKDQCTKWGLAAPPEAPRAPIEVKVIADPSEP